MSQSTDEVLGVLSANLMLGLCVARPSPAQYPEGGQTCWHQERADIKNLVPHDLRRTCARLCHLAGGELEQIQFLLGHASVQTTERYLGCKQKFHHAANA